MRGFSKIFDKDREASCSLAVLPILFWFYWNSGQIEQYSELIIKYSKHKTFGLELEF